MAVRGELAVTRVEITRQEAFRLRGAIRGDRPERRSTGSGGSGIKQQPSVPGPIVRNPAAAALQNRPLPARAAQILDRQFHVAATIVFVCDPRCVRRPYRILVKCVLPADLRGAAACRIHDQDGPGRAHVQVGRRNPLPVGRERHADVVSRGTNILDPGAGTVEPRQTRLGSHRVHRRPNQYAARRHRAPVRGPAQAGCGRVTGHEDNVSAIGRDRNKSANRGLLFGKDRERGERGRRRGLQEMHTPNE